MISNHASSKNNTEIFTFLTSFNCTDKKCKDFLLFFALFPLPCFSLAKCLFTALRIDFSETQNLFFRIIKKLTHSHKFLIFNRLTLLCVGMMVYHFPIEPLSYDDWASIVQSLTLFHAAKGAQMHHGRGPTGKATTYNRKIKHRQSSNFRHNYTFPFLFHRFFSDIFCKDFRRSHL